MTTNTQDTTATLHAVDDFDAAVAIGDTILMAYSGGITKTFRLEGVEPEKVLVRQVCAWDHRIRGPLLRLHPWEVGLRTRCG